MNNFLMFCQQCQKAKLLLPHTPSCRLHCTGGWEGQCTSHVSFHWCSRKWNWFVAVPNSGEWQSCTPCQTAITYFSREVGCFVIKTRHWGWFSGKILYSIFRSFSLEWVYPTFSVHFTDYPHMFDQYIQRWKCITHWYFQLSSGFHFSFWSNQTEEKYEQCFSFS